MLTPNERALLQRHVSIDGDGNVVGSDNTVQVNKVDAETYVTEVNDQRIIFTVQDLRQIHVQGSQVAGVGDNWHVEGGIHYNISQTASSDALNHPHVYHNLPQPDYGEFVGRKAELAQVHRILRPYPHSRHAVVTIDGIGGIGKSALALEVAHRYLRDYDRLPEEERFDAIIWTSAKASVLTANGIAPRQQITRTLEDIYTAIAVTLEREAITRARPAEQDALVTKALTRQRTLLVVDNLETVDDKRVNAFLRELPAPTKAIVTTRHRINVAYPIRLTGMPEEDGLALIAQECAKKSVTLTDAEAENLYRRTGGVPLAMVWSVAQMGYGYGVDSVLRRLSEPTGDIARFCFEGAMERIRGKPAHKLLMALSLFATDASREALGYVAGLGEDILSQNEGLVTLERLSLVNKQGGRFSMLPLTKEYATSERSKKPDREEAFVERWIEFFRKLTEDCGNSYWRWYNYEPLVVEGENIIAAVEWAYRSNKPQVVLDLMPSVYWYLDIVGHWNDVLKYGERALELANLVGDRLSVVGLMCLFGWTLGQMGKYSEGEQFLGQGLSTCKLIRGSGRYEAESAVLVHLGQIARKSGEYAKARSFYEKSSEVIESHDLSDQHQTNLDYEWGKLARDRGDWKLAKEYFAKVDDWAGRKEEKEQPFDVALARGAQGNYALALYHIGEYEKAKRLCIDSLKFLSNRAGRVIWRH